MRMIIYDELYQTKISLYFMAADIKKTIAYLFNLTPFDLLTHGKYPQSQQ
jgi:hypothetical protein